MASAQAPLERGLASAERAAQAGQTRRAWQLWRRLARRYPADGRAAIAMARVEPLDRARAAEAEHALEAHLAAAPSPSVEARRLHAWMVAARDPAGGIDRVIPLVGLQDAEAAILLARMAALAIEEDDLEAARRALEAAHRAMPQENAYLSDLGAVQLALGDPAAAAESFARILGRRPDDLAARRDFAGALIAAGRPAEAVTQLAQALERHPEEPELAIELARAALEAGEPALAERAARAAIEALGDADARGHSALGAALAAQRRREAARLAFAEALRRDPRDLRAQQGLEALSSEDEPTSGAGHRLAPP